MLSDKRSKLRSLELAGCQLHDAAASLLAKALALEFYANNRLRRISVNKGRKRSPASTLRSRHLELLAGARRPHSMAAANPGHNRNHHLTHGYNHIHNNNHNHN